MEKAWQSFDEFHLNGIPEITQKTSDTSSVDELIGLDESITKELERSLDDIRGPFIKKIAADNVPLIHIKKYGEEVIINPLANIRDIACMGDLRNLEYLYNQFIPSTDNYVFGRFT